jgi:hypothetical protein
MQRDMPYSRAKRNLFDFWLACGAVSRGWAHSALGDAVQGIAGKLLEVTPWSRAVLVICKVSNRQPRANYTKPRIERSQFAQQRLERGITETSFLRTRRILERLQPI